MREGKKFKKLLIGVAAAAMTMLCTLPVSAATKSFKPITVKAGRCIHLLNTNIQSNAITNYSYRIQPQSSGDRKSTRLNSSHRCTSRMPSSA